MSRGVGQSGEPVESFGVDGRMRRHVDPRVHRHERRRGSSCVNAQRHKRAAPRGRRNGHVTVSDLREVGTVAREAL